MKPMPTWVNKEFVRGPIYHYENLTEEQASALGIEPLPDQAFGRVSKVSGATARRLRSGLINVAIPFGSPLLRDEHFTPFLDSLYPEALPCGRETMPVPLDESQGMALSSAGQAGNWSFDVGSKRVVWSNRCHEIYGVPIGLKVTIEDVFDRIHPMDRVRMRTALNDAVYLGKGIDEAYRIIVRDEVREVHARGRAFDVSPQGMIRRIAGLVAYTAATLPKRPSIGRALGALLAALIVSIPDAPFADGYATADDDPERITWSAQQA